jgi:DNA-binding MarR family transcriptional regulator
MSEKQLLIYKLLKVYGPSYPRDIAKRMGYKESAWVSRQLKVLVKRGLLGFKGSAKNKVYFIMHENN